LPFDKPCKNPWSSRKSSRSRVSGKLVARDLRPPPLPPLEEKESIVGDNADEEDGDEEDDEAQ
jgi:hypothetical protein